MSKKKTGYKVWYAYVKNYDGIHCVFYGLTKPVLGDHCPGIAGRNNRVVGMKSEKRA